jgi:hypothetical protein
MQFRKALALSALVVSLTVGAALDASAEVQLTMQNGRVTLIAKNATLSQILAEWAKVGQTRIVNAERVPGGPVTLTLTDVPEAQALDILLRSLSGYMAAPRAVAAANLSQFDRVVILPTLAAPPVQTATAPPPPPMFQQAGQPQTFPQPAQPQPGQVVDDQEDAPGPRNGPVFNAFPPPQVANPMPQGVPMAMPGVVGTPQGPLVLPQQQPMPQQAPTTSAPATSYPGQPTAAPTGTSVPGMIVAPPQQPGQPPRRPGGGQ